MVLLSVEKLKKLEFRERENLDHKIKILKHGKEFVTYLIDGKDEISVAVEEGYEHFFLHDLEDVYKFINFFDEDEDDAMLLEEW